MSYTLHQEPKAWTPCYNDIIFVVSSSNKTQSNFKYIADVYIGTEIIRLKCFPDPNYGSGVFNIGRIIETYVNKNGSDINNYSSTGFEVNPNSGLIYYIYFGEEYGTDVSIVEYPNIKLSSILYAWNAVIDFLPFQSFDYTKYSSSGNKILNYYNANLQRKIGLTEMSWIYAINKNVSHYSSGVIQAYDSTDTLIRECIIINPFNSDVTFNHHLIRFGSGALNLNNIASSAVIDFVGSGTIINNNTSYYDIALVGNSNFSDIYRYNIIEDDCKYKKYRLHWLNKLGAYESFSFTKKSYTDTTIKKDNYKRISGCLTSASSYGYNISDRGIRSFNIDNKDTLHLKSNWLSDQENILLKGLIESPEIYIEKLTVDGVDYTLVPVTCVDSKFKEKNSLNDKVFNLDITLEYCFNRYSQRQ